MTGTVATAQLDAENPWPGLEAFEENARAFFHGRDHEAQTLLHYVLDAPVTVLFGRSGLGKTSVLRAGLFPLLRERNFLPIYVRFDVKPGAPPLTRQLHHSVRHSVQAEVPDAMLLSDDESLWEYLHRIDFELWNSHNYPLTPVIVIDQFEELFTLGERIRHHVRAFRNDLGDLAENRIPAYLAARIDDDATVAARYELRSRNYKLLISLREDFLPELEGWSRLIPALGRSRMRLHRLRAGAAFDAVQSPAGHMMTDALARRVVDIIAGEDLGRDSDTNLRSSAGPVDELVGGEVEPALLSLFCRELNEERKRRGKSHFDSQLVEEAKRDILSNYYLSCVGDLPQRVAHFIESQLITEKGFRDSYAREDAVPAHLTDDELARLISLRLLRLEDHYGAQRIELTHDVLTGVVREHRDRRRQEEERVALAVRAEEERRAAAKREAELRAEQQRQHAELQAAKRLAQVEAAAKEEAQAHATVLRRRTRLLRIVVAIALVIAVIAAVGAVQAHVARNDARNALREAIAAKLIYEAHGMLAGTRPGGDARAFKQLLAAEALSDEPDTGALWNAIVARRGLLKIVESPRSGFVSSNHDGTRLLSENPDGVLRVWQTDTGLQTGSPMSGRTAYAVALSPDGQRIVAGDRDGGLQLWDVMSGKPVATVAGDDNAKEITSVAFSPDGTRVVTVDDSRMLRLWDAATSHQFRTLRSRQLDRKPSAVAFSPRGDRIAIATDFGDVTQWDAATGKQIGDAIVSSQSVIASIAFSPDGGRIVAGGTTRNEATLQMWDATTGQPIGGPMTMASENDVDAVAFSPDGQTVAAGSDNGIVQVWDSAGRSIGEPLTGHTARVNFLMFSPDGARIISGSGDGTARVWDVPTRHLVTGPSTLEAGSAAFSPDGQRVISGDKSGTVLVWNALSGQPITPPITGHDGTVYAVAFSPDGRRVASGGDFDGAVRVWDALTGRQIGQTMTGQRHVRALAFSPDGRHLATAGWDDTIRLWEADTGKPFGVPMTGHKGGVFAVAFSPDGQRIVSGGEDGTLRLWDAATGGPSSPTITAQEDTTIFSVAFSPDGKRIVSCGSRSVKLWNAVSGEQIGPTMKGHRDQVNVVAFSPDGQLIVSGDRDGAIQVWDAANNNDRVGEPLAAHKGWVLDLSFDPDGRMVSAGGDNTVEIWPKLTDFGHQLCGMVSVNMSQRQWRDWVSHDIDYIKACPDLPIAPD